MRKCLTEDKIALEPSCCDNKAIDLKVMGSYPFGVSLVRLKPSGWKKAERLDFKCLYCPSNVKFKRECKPHPPHFIYNGAFARFEPALGAKRQIINIKMRVVLGFILAFKLSTLNKVAFGESQICFTSPWIRPRKKKCPPP
jgi:hypothetical protein